MKNDNLFTRTHNSLVGGYGVYTADVKCEKCGTLNRYYSDNSCVSCKKSGDRKRRYPTAEGQRNIMRELERIHEQRQLEAEITSYAI